MAFRIFIDFGIVRVPDTYTHDIWLASFWERNHNRFYYYNSNITDENFLNPTYILKSGDKFWVRAFEQIVPNNQPISGTATSEECFAFLEKHGSVFLGAQGLALVFEQKRDLLIKGLSYVSFDYGERLWKGGDGFHHVPEIEVSSSDTFAFSMSPFESLWYACHILLVYHKIGNSPA